MAQGKKIENIGDYKRAPFHLNAGMIIFGILFVYLVACTVLYLKTKHIVGYEVLEGSLSMPNVYEGIALRDEVVYPCNGNGYINFFARESEHVACGDLVYSLDGSGKIAEMMEEQEEKLLLSDTDLSEIRNELINFQHAVGNDTFYKTYSFKDQMDQTALKLSNYNMLDNMNAVTGGGNAVSFQYAARSGLVEYGIDGYEDITPSDVNADMFGEKRKEQVRLEANQLVSPQDKAYKLICSEKWSIVIPVTPECAAQLEEEQYVKVRFLKNQYESWAKVTRLDLSDGTYVQLDLTNSMITFASDRFIDLEILYHQEKGLKVPNSAIASQDFFLIPCEYKMGGGSDTEGEFLREYYTEEGKSTTESVTAKIYEADDRYYYVDRSSFEIGDVICMPGSEETYTISKAGSLEGVYNINKGYADFVAITILYANEEYSIIKSNTQYGLSEYDYIALDADAVSADEFIYE